jgi:hypothetical protein
VKEVLANNYDSITYENFRAVVMRVRRLQATSLCASDHDGADHAE